MMKLSSRGIAVRDVVAAVLLVLACTAFVFVNVQKHLAVSPIDEYVYIDYVAKVPSQGVVHRGEETGALAREYLACNGVRMVGYYESSLCATDGKGHDAQYPNAGSTSADIYTPLYPGATWVGAKIFEGFGLDLVQAARMTGMIWLAGAAVLLFAAARRSGVPTLLAFGVTLWVSVSPPTQWSNTYVSTDATSLFAASLMLALLTLDARRRGLRLGLFAAASVFVVLLKVQNIAAVGFVALLLVSLAISRWWRRRRRDPAHGFSELLLKDSDFRIAWVSVAAAIAAEGLWLAVRSFIAIAPSPDQGVGAPLSRTALLNELLKFFPSTMNSAVPFSEGVLVDTLALLGSSVMAAGVIGLVFSARRASRREFFAGSAIAVSLLLGPLLAVMTVVTAGYYFVLPSRYGLILLPIFAFSLILLTARKTWPGYVVTALGLVSFTIMTFTLTPA